MSVNGVGGGMIAAQTQLLSSVLKDSQAQVLTLLQSMVSVDAQNRLSADQMAIAAEIINAYGGSVDVMA